VLHVCLELKTHLGLAGNVQTSEYDGDRMSLLPCLSVKRATGMHMLGPSAALSIYNSSKALLEPLAASMLRAR